MEYEQLKKEVQELKQWKAVMEQYFPVSSINAFDQFIRNRAHLPEITYAPNKAANSENITVVQEVGPPLVTVDVIDWPDHWAQIKFPDKQTDFPTFIPVYNGNRTQV